MELKTSSSFKTTGLLQPWQTLCKIFSKCLTTRVTGWDQPLLQIMQMMKIQRQSWNEDSSLDDLRRNEAHGAFGCMLLERQQNKEETDKMIAKAMLQERGKLQAEISSQIQNAIDTNIPSLVDASVRSYMSGHILHVHPAQPQTTSVPEQQYQLYLSMKADPQLQQQDIAIWLALQMKFKTLQVPQTTCRTPAVRPRDQDDPHDDAHPEGENSAKRQKTSEYEAHVTGESSGQVNEKRTRRKSYLKYHGRSVMTIKVAELRQLAYEMFETKIKGSSGPEKIVLSLHKFLAIIFNDVDIEERTSKWVNKCVNKFNPYAQYGVMQRSST
ncbi:hypothetical protein Tco_0151380 [Tanacetum coccineum]